MDEIQTARAILSDRFERHRGAGNPTCGRAFQQSEPDLEKVRRSQGWPPHVRLELVTVICEAQLCARDQTRRLAGKRRVTAPSAGVTPRNRTDSLRHRIITIAARRVLENPRIPGGPPHRDI